MDILTPGSAQNPDLTQRCYEFIGGPLHNSKLPVHPNVILQQMEVGLEVGGKMHCYKPEVISSSGGRKKLVYVHVP